VKKMTSWKNKEETSEENKYSDIHEIEMDRYNRFRFFGFRNLTKKRVECKMGLGSRQNYFAKFYHQPISRLGFPKLKNRNLFNRSITIYIWVDNDSFWSIIFCKFFLKSNFKNEEREIIFFVVCKKRRKMSSYI